MLNNNPNSKPTTRPSILSSKKSVPRLSLSLHTMPRTSSGRFRKWLFLGLLIFAIMILVAFLLFS